MSKVYIVLFRDGELQLFANKVTYSNFEIGTKIFTVPDYLPIINICKWIGNDYKHSEIKEIKK